MTLKILKCGSISRVKQQSGEVCEKHFVFYLLDFSLKVPQTLADKFLSLGRLPYCPTKQLPNHLELFHRDGVLFVLPRQQLCVVSCVASGSWLSTRRWISLKPNLAEDRSLLKLTVACGSRSCCTRSDHQDVISPSPSNHPIAICSQPTRNIFSLSLFCCYDCKNPNGSFACRVSIFNNVGVCFLNK